MDDGNRRVWLDQTGSSGWGHERAAGKALAFMVGASLAIAVIFLHA